MRRLGGRRSRPRGYWEILAISPDVQVLFVLRSRPVTNPNLPQGAVSAFGTKLGRKRLSSSLSLENIHLYARVCAEPVCAEPVHEPSCRASAARGSDDWRKGLNSISAERHAHRDRSPCHAGKLTTPGPRNVGSPPAQPTSQPGSQSRRLCRNLAVVSAGAYGEITHALGESPSYSEVDAVGTSLGLNDAGMLQISPRDEWDGLGLQYPETVGEVQTMGPLDGSPLRPGRLFALDPNLPL